MPGCRLQDNGAVQGIATGQQRNRGKHFLGGCWIQDDLRPLAVHYRDYLLPVRILTIYGPATYDQWSESI